MNQNHVKNYLQYYISTISGYRKLYMRGNTENNRVRVPAYSGTRRA